MKSTTYILLTAVVLSLALAGQNIRAAGSKTVLNQDNIDPTEFIRVADDGWHFETAVSGQSFTPFGVNYYDPGTYHSDPYPAYDVIGSFDSTAVDRQLGKIQELGANIIRIFLSVVSFEPDLFGLRESNFETLDKLIEIAKNHNLRLIFDLVNDWEGEPAWQSWEYYADETTLEGYEFYLEALGSRYANEPAIFAWSLQNEPYVRGPDSGIMGDLWTPYVQFKYGNEVNLEAAWSDYPRSGESWDQIQQPDYSSEYVPLNNLRDRRLYDYQLYREDIAYNWVRRLAGALRRTDPNHMISIGLDQHSAPIKNAIAEKTYTAFNPQKIAPLLDYSSVHAYDWWDNHVAEFIKGIARYSYAGKPVVVEEFNLGEADWTMDPLLDSASGWLHWGTFATPGDNGPDNLFDLNEKRTPGGNVFHNIASWLVNTVPVRASDAAQVTVDLEQALTSVDYQNGVYDEYINTFNSSGGPVGFDLLNCQPPLVLGGAAADLPEHLIIGQQYKISWTKIDWPILAEIPVSVLLSRDGGGSWETLAGNIADENEFNWTATGPVSGSCLIRVVDSVDENIFTEGAAEFSIVGSTKVEPDRGSQPWTLRLMPAYPNPFNPRVEIGYQLPAAGEVRLDVYNVAGQLVRTLVRGRETAGNHLVEWNGSDWAGGRVDSGLYLYRLRFGNQIQTRRMLLVK